MVRKYKPKFKIDDIVTIKDEFGSNPAYNTIFVGKIQSIMIHRGKGIFRGEDKRGIYYDINNYSRSYIPEKELKKYNGKI